LKENHLWNRKPKNSLHLGGGGDIRKGIQTPGKEKKGGRGEVKGQVRI